MWYSYLWYRLVLRMGCMIEQEQGFAPDYPVPKHTPLI